MFRKYLSAFGPIIQHCISSIRNYCRAYSIVVVVVVVVFRPNSHSEYGMFFFIFLLLKVISEHVDQMISGEDFERTIQNFDNNFSLHLMDLLEKLSHYSTIDCEHQMLNIIARLDHNGFYTAQLEKKAAAQGENRSLGCNCYFNCALSLEAKSYLWRPSVFFVIVLINVNCLTSSQFLLLHL